MTITMLNLERLNLAEMKEFVEGSRTVRFAVKGRGAIYALLETVLRSQQYRRLNKGQKGIVRRFLTRVTGLSRAQVTRLIVRWSKTRRLEPRAVSRRRFATRYTAEDIRLLAVVDAAHQDLSGAALRHVLQREYEVFGKPEFQRLARAKWHWASARAGL